MRCLRIRGWRASARRTTRPIRNARAIETANHPTTVSSNSAASTGPDPSPVTLPLSKRADRVEWIGGSSPTARRLPVCAERLCRRHPGQPALPRAPPRSTAPLLLEPRIEVRLRVLHEAAHLLRRRPLSVRAQSRNVASATPRYSAAARSPRKRGAGSAGPALPIFPVTGGLGRWRPGPRDRAVGQARPQRLQRHSHSARCMTQRQQASSWPRAQPFGPVTTTNSAGLDASPTTGTGARCTIRESTASPAPPTRGRPSHTDSTQRTPGASRHRGSASVVAGARLLVRAPLSRFHLDHAVRVIPLP